jgi:hypothetical protein
VSLAVAIGLAIRARRHFLAGRPVLAWGMVAGAVTSGAVAELWIICTMLGVPPFFMSGTRVLPCEHEPAQGVALPSTARAAADGAVAKRCGAVAC